jgi:hypothetical protein
MNITARQTTLIQFPKPADRVPPSDKNQQFTPGYIADFARSVFGRGIELDPTSSVIANEVIKADRIYTEADDALTQDWQTSTLFFNPPYGAGLIGPMIDKFLDELDKIDQAIVLVNSSTNVGWYQALVAQCDRLLLPDHRIQFWTAEGRPEDESQRAIYQQNPPGNNRYAQTIFYFGHNADLFDAECGPIGKSLSAPKPITEVDSIETHIKKAKNMCVLKIEDLVSQGAAFGCMVSSDRSSGKSRQHYFCAAGSNKLKYVPVKAVQAMQADVDRGKQMEKMQRAIDLIEQIETLIN